MHPRFSAGNIADVRFMQIVFSRQCSPRAAPTRSDSPPNIIDNHVCYLDAALLV